MRLLLMTTIVCVLTNCLPAASAQTNSDTLSDALLNQALADQSAGKHKSAIELFKKDLKTATGAKRFAVVKALMTSFEATSRWDDAFEILNDEIAKNPFSGDLKFLFAKTLYDHGDFNKGLNQVELAERLIRGNVELLNLKAVLLQKLNRHTEAIAVLTEILDLAPDSYESLVLRAHSYTALEENSNAYDDLKEAYDARPYDEEIVSLFVQSALANHEYSEVKKYGQKCAAQFPNNFSCRESLANAYFSTEEYPKAISSFEAALKIEPKNISSRFKLAQAYELNGDKAKSNEQFDTLLNLSPENEAAMRTWYNDLISRKDYAGAGRQLSRFNGNNPQNLWAAAKLSDLLGYVGQTDQAVAAMEVCTKLNRSDVSRLFLARAYDMAQRYSDAASELKDVSNSSPFKTFDLGIVYFKDKKWDKAIKTWMAVNKSAPTYFKANANMAMAYVQKGDLQKALDLLTKLDPPKEERDAVSDELSALQKQKARSPAVAPEKTKHPLKPYLNWELPAL